VRSKFSARIGRLLAERAVEGHVERDQACPPRPHRSRAPAVSASGSARLRGLRSGSSTGAMTTGCRSGLGSSTWRDRWTPRLPPAAPGLGRWSGTDTSGQGPAATELCAGRRRWRRRSPMSLEERQVGLSRSTPAQALRAAPELGFHRVNPVGICATDVDAPDVLLGGFDGPRTGAVGLRLGLARMRRPRLRLALPGPGVLAAWTIVATAARPLRRSTRGSLLRLPLERPTSWARSARCWSRRRARSHGADGEVALLMD